MDQLKTKILPKQEMTTTDIQLTIYKRQKTAKIAEQQQKKIVYRELLKWFFAVGVFNFGFNFITTAEYVHFRDILQTAGFTSQTLISILLAVALTALCLGSIIGGVKNDKLRTKYGQRAPFIFGGTIIGGLLLLIVPLVTQLLKYGLLTVILLFLIFFSSHLFLGIAYAPWLALMVDLFKKKEQTWAAVVITVFGAGGAAVALIIFSHLLDTKLGWVVWIVTAFVLIIAGIITSFCIPKRNPVVMGADTTVKVWKIPRILIQTGGKKWSLLLIVSLFWSFGSHLIETGLIDSLTERFGIRETTAALANYLLGAYSIILLVPLVFLINKMGKIPSSIVASFIYSLFCIMLAIMNSYTMIYYIAFVGGMGNILLSTLQISLPADIVPKGFEASFMGIFFVFGTIAKPFASLVQGVLLDIGGLQSKSIKIFGGYPWVFLFAGLIFILAEVPLLVIQKNANLNYKSSLENRKIE
jgi:MFS family permease